MRVHGGERQRRAASRPHLRAQFRGENRSDGTHASSTDPDARLFKNATGQAARLCFMGHAPMENRSGLVVDTRHTLVMATAEREAALAMDGELSARHPITLGADKGCDAARVLDALRASMVAPHVSGRKSTIAGPATRSGSVCLYTVRGHSEWLRRPFQAAAEIGVAMLMYAWSGVLPPSDECGLLPL
ncbi:hypothetical protein BH23PSE1_BH23PSE1_18690 [soil metagenome]